MHMHLLATIFGCLFLAGVLLDCFQTIILPRRPVGRFRITRLFLLSTWNSWQLLARLSPSRRVREQLYSIYGPLALLLLFVLWAALLTFAYALIYFGMHMPFADPTQPLTAFARLRTCVYVSGTTLFTLGLADVQPATPMARMLVVLEAGTGLGFVALVIGYLPVLYGAFSAREVHVALLDARAGSPPTAGELLFRHSFEGGQQALTELLAEWERWCATMLETHISYPLLCYYRSQHDNQSWLAALTAVLDACALLIAAIDTAPGSGASSRQAQLTFAVGRHTLVDLGHVFRRERRERDLLAAPPQRLQDDEMARLCDLLTRAGFTLCGDTAMRDRLLAVRRLYEPHAQALGQLLRLDLPLWCPPPEPQRPDAWTRVAGLRAPAPLNPQADPSLGVHISPRSAASHLHDDASHPL